MNCPTLILLGMLCPQGGAAAAPPARGRHPDATTAAGNPAKGAAPK